MDRQVQTEAQIVVSNRGVQPVVENGKPDVLGDDDLLVTEPVVRQPHSPQTVVDLIEESQVSYCTVYIDSKVKSCQLNRHDFPGWGSTSDLCTSSSLGGRSRIRLGGVPTSHVGRQLPMQICFMKCVCQNKRIGILLATLAFCVEIELRIIFRGKVRDQFYLKTSVSRSRTDIALRIFADYLSRSEAQTTADLHVAVGSNMFL